MRIRLGILFVLAVLVMAVAAPATATAPKAAVVINPATFACGFLDGNGNLFFTANNRIVANHSGNWLLKCEGSKVPNATGKAVHYSGPKDGLCGTSDPVLGPETVLTTDWNETVSAGGQATLTCHFKAVSWPVSKP